MRDTRRIEEHENLGTLVPASNVMYVEIEDYIATHPKRQEASELADPEFGWLAPVDAKQCACFDLPADTTAVVEWNDGGEPDAVTELRALKKRDHERIVNESTSTLVERILAHYDHHAPDDHPAHGLYAEWRRRQQKDAVPTPDATTEERRSTVLRHYNNASDTLDTMEQAFIRGNRNNVVTLALEAMEHAGRAVLAATGTGDEEDVGTDTPEGDDVAERLKKRSRQNGLCIRYAEEIEKGRKSARRARHADRNETSRETSVDTRNAARMYVSHTYELVRPWERSSRVRGIPYSPQDNDR